MTEWIIIYPKVISSIYICYVTLDPCLIVFLVHVIYFLQNGQNLFLILIFLYYFFLSAFWDSPEAEVGVSFDFKVFCSKFARLLTFSQNHCRCWLFHFEFIGSSRKRSSPTLNFLNGFFPLQSGINVTLNEILGYFRF